MPKFLIEADGKKFEVTAPDQETALAAFAEAAGMDAADTPAAPTRQSEYDTALEAYRQSQYPDMDPAAFAQMVDKTDMLKKADLGDLAANGVVFGLGDEINSAMEATGSQIQNWLGRDAPGFGEAFGKTQALQDARLNLAREESGIPGAVAEFGSSLASMGPERAGVEAIVNAIRTGVQPAARVAPSMLKTALTSGSTGAGLGAVAGFTNAEGGLEERGKAALLGAGGGAVLGTAAPLVMRGVGAGVRNVADRFATNDAARSMGVDPEAARWLQATLAADDALSPAGQQRMAAAGAERMPADAGPSARNALDFAIQSSGRAGQMATEAIGERVGRDSQAIGAALDQALGTPQGVTATRTGIRQGSAPARSRAYDDAYAAPIDYSSNAGRDIEELLGRLEPSEIAAANTLMRKEGLASQQILADVADDGTITYRTMPDVRQIDYITRALNDVAEAANAQGKLGGTTNRGRIYGGLATQIRNATREAVPEYAHALETAAEPIRLSQAVQLGGDLLRMPRDQVAEAVANMTGPELRGVAQGLRSNIDDLMAAVQRAVADGDVDAREAIKALKIMSSRATREKVGMVIGDAEATRLFDEVDRATRSFELRAGVADNSATFRRQEMGRRVDATTNPQGVLATAGRGKPVNAVQRIVQAVTGLTDERALAAKDAMMQDAVRVLTQRGPAADQMVRDLGNLGASSAGIDAIAQALTRTGALSGPAAYQYGRQQGARR